MSFVQPSEAAAAAQRNDLAGVAMHSLGFLSSAISGLGRMQQGRQATAAALDAGVDTATARMMGVMTQFNPCQMGATARLAWKAAEVGQMGFALGGAVGAAATAWHSGNLLDWLQAGVSGVFATLQTGHRVLSHDENDPAGVLATSGTWFRGP